jgi:serine/threonine protein kinase
VVCLYAEVFLGSTSYGPEVDMWGIGCLVVEMLSKEHPFQDREFRIY